MREFQIGDQVIIVAPQPGSANYKQWVDCGYAKYLDLELVRTIVRPYPLVAYKEIWYSLNPDCFLGDPNASFAIFSEWLKLTSITCNCDLHLLMAHGCCCGAFEIENIKE